MPEENKSDPTLGIPPEQSPLIKSETVSNPPIVSNPPVPPPPPAQVSLGPPRPVTPAPVPGATPPQTKKKRFNLHFNRKLFKKIAIIVVLVSLFGGSLFGAYSFGKSNERVIIQEPPDQPINLPPQAIVVAECVKGRGKQYVLPKDIPGGPIYDVVNDKVIAIEYNLNVNELVTNPDKFSNTIRRLAQDYPIDHLKLIPIIPKDGGGVENALLVTFVVTKEEAAKVTCEDTEETGEAG